MTNDKVFWEPCHGAQEVALMATDFVDELFIDSSRGTGKTDVSFGIIAKYINRGYGENLKIVFLRKTYKALKNATKRARQFFEYSGAFPGCRYLKSENKFEFACGAEFYLDHCESELQYSNNWHGDSIQLLIVDELTTWKNLEVYDLMKSCMRSSYNTDFEKEIERKEKYPLNPLIVSMTNPYGLGTGVVKKRFVQSRKSGRIFEHNGKQIMRIRFHFSENKHLPENYHDSFNDLPDHKKSAFKYGNWNSRVGGAFSDNFDPEIHVLQPFKIPRSWECKVCYDHGRSSPYAAVFLAKSDGTPAKIVKDSSGRYELFCPPKGSWIQFGEYYGTAASDVDEDTNIGTKETPSEIAQNILDEMDWLIKNRMEGHHIEFGEADSSIFSSQDGNPISDQLEDAGVSFKSGYKSASSRGDFVELGNQLLKNTLNKDDKPHWYIVEDCYFTLDQIPVLPLDPKKPDQILTTAEDHLADAIAYGFVTKEHKTKIGSI